MEKNENKLQKLFIEADERIKLHNSDEISAKNEEEERKQNEKLVYQKLWRTNLIASAIVGLVSNVLSNATSTKGAVVIPDNSKDILGNLSTLSPSNFEIDDEKLSILLDYSSGVKAAGTWGDGNCFINKSLLESEEYLDVSGNEISLPYLNEVLDTYDIKLEYTEDSIFLGNTGLIIQQVRITLPREKQKSDDNKSYTK